MGQARAIFRNTAVLATARIIERTSGLVLTVIISRHLGASGLGVYATVIAYFGLISQAGEFGSTNLIVRELSKDKARTSSYVSHTSLMALTASGVVMAIALLVIPHLGYSANLRHGLELIVLAVAPGTLNTIQEGVFVAHQRVEFEAMSTFVQNVALVTASVVLLKTGHGVVSLIVAFVAAEYAVTIAYFVIINRYIAKIRIVFRREVAREILAELKGFAGSSLVAGLFARPEIIILSLVAGTVEVGYYSGASKLVEVFAFIPQVFMINVFPILSRSFHVKDGRAQDIQDMALKYLLAFALPVSAGLFFAAHRIIDTFYRENFDPAVTLLRILALSTPIVCLHAVLWRVLAARGQQGRVFRVQLVSTSVRLGGGTVLIALFNAVGAAISAPASLLVHVGLLARATREDGTRIPVVRLAWRFAAAALIMGGIVLVISRSVELWLLVPIAAVIYVPLVFAFRAFSADELAALKSLVPTRFARVGRTG